MACSWSGMLDFLDTLWLYLISGLINFEALLLILCVHPASIADLSEGLLQSVQCPCGPLVLQLFKSGSHGEHSQAQDQGNSDKNSINSRVGCATARKLFTEDCFTEREDLLEVPNCDDPSAGLSYIDSQEPGELSQANALNFMERFVNDNLMELDDEIDLRNNTERNSKLISWPQSLVKKTIERSYAGDAGNFEWDNFLEDDGGGDIYRRMKEEFYGNRSHSWRPSTHPQKRKGRKLDKSLNGDQPKSADKMTVHSDSKVLLCKSKDNDKKVREGQMNFRKNNSNDFDEQFNSDSLRGQLVATGTKIGAAKELNDVGFDTQMAAEAMEALFYGETATDPNSNQGVQSISKGSSKGSFRVKTGKKISSSLRKDVSCSDVARFRRRSKRTKRSEESSVLMEKHSKSVGKDCNMELLLPKLKKAKLRGGGSIRKQHPEEVHTTPIAHRTGQSVKNVEMAETMCQKLKVDFLYCIRIKKEKELGFCMPVSLARARKPLLQVKFSRFTYCFGCLFHLDFHNIVEVMQGRRVLITPNTKPGKETILRLVTTVHGQAVERIGRSAMKDDKFPDDLLVLSCEEDYEISVRFLEIGAEIFSSELLLNGIVTQKLDYERHRLFEDHVGRTRSTVWLKKDNKFLPVTKV
ncbi:uncharacterized protein LOC120205426 [Hibiscus syriacus]|uniref:uncharacterized protein LOC120205426 n=1 Tax=Hibiscus syriacus TaxID=106335 RepID=UPI001920EB96|nr:uncharacterized protein LOC120205426 [Hibiscus syriacus]